MVSLNILPRHIHKTQSTTKQFQWINPMVLCSHWADTYLHTCKPSNLSHQKRMTYSYLNALSNTTNNKQENIPLEVMKEAMN